MKNSNDLSNFDGQLFWSLASDEHSLFQFNSTKMIL